MRSTKQYASIHSAHMQRQRAGGDLCVSVGDATLASQRVSLTGREQRAGQNRAEVIEGSPPNALCLHGHAVSRLRRSSREQLREEGLVAVTVATKSSSHAQKTRDSIPAQVHCRNRTRVRRVRKQTCVCEVKKGNHLYPGSPASGRSPAETALLPWPLPESGQKDVKWVQEENKMKGNEALKIRPVSETLGLSEPRQTGASPDRSWSSPPWGESLFTHQNIKLLNTSVHAYIYTDVLDEDA